ncbi:iron chelate uptake ABC transporter family permease subunit [Amycolatopsis acidiphila]|uniref:Iron chelate uptake ABC transporter family permease subunit n=1 Tax=Amycolatopsis acidiphila TaxID=715473 RepID=A0A558A3V7_9PSEU|nr:iron chelate uptake ABC transporter family permease subunit [Amycolatopsis acidiphila]TVT18927.1 iron chelate uptake ABC transporter family permease subunit [Amycolatopsis acidiphila]UIJ60629.1 iron chelate uptake ABC transporter family permease subunit [Amycolatopsis acidiphila]GHG81682.1 ABC transporter permease [Amycolatopsis acidiphila]
MTRRAMTVSAGLVVAILVVAVLALGVGSISVAPLDVVRTLLGNGSRLTDFAVLDLRLPRVLIALCVGAALGMSGAVFQSLSRNPLGSPDIIGFNYGATTGGLLMILVFGGSLLAVSLGAIAGGLATALAVYLLAWQRGVRGTRLVLVGIGVSAILQAVNFYLIVNAKLADVARATVWITGSLNNLGWEHVWPALIALAVVVPLVLVGVRWLDILEMGDDSAAALGVRVEPSRLYLIVVGTAACAAATAVAGPIAFVSLTAPQLAKRLTRAPGAGILPAAWMGALLVLAADFVAQRVAGSGTLPVGVATAALGGAYLAWLLRRTRR